MKTFKAGQTFRLILQSGGVAKRTCKIHSVNGDRVVIQIGKSSFKTLRLSDCGNWLMHPTLFGQYLNMHINDMIEDVEED